MHHASRLGDSLFPAVVRSSLGVLARFASPRLSILIFHRVHRHADNIFPQEPDAARFDGLMQYVARTYQVMTLGDAVTSLKKQTLPQRALVITFDDGYADNAEVALPILQRHGLKASFFVASGFLDGGRMWNDSVIECLRASRKTNIDLSAFQLGNPRISTLDERQRAISMLLGHIKYLGLAERETAISHLQRVCEVPDLPTNLMMRSEQVKVLHAAGMEIGAHTVNHPILTSLAAPEARHEIIEGRRHLQSIIDAPIDVFAYPNGKPNQDYAEEHVATIRDIGFRGAVSTAPGVSQCGSDLFQLPRFTPWDKSLSKWAIRLLANQRNDTYATVKC